MGADFVQGSGGREVIADDNNPHFEAIEWFAVNRWRRIVCYFSGDGGVRIAVNIETIGRAE
jgi:hypothetical protein